MSDIRSTDMSVVRRYAAMRLDSVTLLIPSHEVHTLEPALAIDRTRVRAGSVGALYLDGAEHAVWCLSDDLRLQSELPGHLRICAVLGDGNVSLTLACSAISSIDGAMVKHYALPPSMQTSGSPVQGLAACGSDVYCRTSFALLAHVLESAV